MKYYDLLGVAPDATRREIRSAYRKRAAELHPDRENGDEDKFKELQIANDILSDPEKRAFYDEHGDIEPEKLSIYERVVAELVGRALDDPFVDVVEFCSKQVTEGTRALDKELEKLIKAEQAIEKKLARVTHKKGSDPVGDMLRSRLADSEMEIGRVELILEALQYADEKIQNDYSFEAPEERPPSQFRSPLQMFTGGNDPWREIASTRGFPTNFYDEPTEEPKD